MSVKVTFMKAAYIGNFPATLVLGPARTCETLALDGTTTEAAQDGECVILCSTEASTVIFAQGATPVATTTTATATSSAGHALPAGQTVAVMMRTGDKIQVKAFA